MSGPLTDDDRSTMMGSLFLVEAPDRAAVERFNRADPFHAAGIWDKVTIRQFVWSNCRLGEAHLLRTKEVVPTSLIGLGQRHLFEPALGHKVLMTERQPGFVELLALSLPALVIDQLTNDVFK
jgi:hypothetical protein